MQSAGDLVAVPGDPPERGVRRRRPRLNARQRLERRRACSPSGRRTPRRGRVDGLGVALVERARRRCPPATREARGRRRARAPSRRTSARRRSRPRRGGPGARRRGRRRRTGASPRHRPARLRASCAQAKSSVERLRASGQDAEVDPRLRGAVLGAGHVRVSLRDAVGVDGEPHVGRRVERRQREPAGDPVGGFLGHAAERERASVDDRRDPAGVGDGRHHELRHPAAAPCARRRRARGCASPPARTGASRRSGSRCRRRARRPSRRARRSGGSSRGGARARGPRRRHAGRTAERADPAPVAEPLRVVERDRGDLVAVPDDEEQLRIELLHLEGALRPRLVVARLVPPLVLERLLDARRARCRPSRSRSNGRSSRPVGPDRRRDRSGEVGDHAEERADAHVPAAGEQLRGARVADEVRRLDRDGLVRGHLRGELERARLGGFEQEGSDAAAGQLRVDVAVREHAAAAALVDVHHAGDAPVVDRHPGIRADVEAVPLLAQLGGGPVGVAVDGAVAGLDEREHLVEVGRRIGAADLHGSEV